MPPRKKTAVKKTAVKKKRSIPTKAKKTTKRATSRRPAKIDKYLIGKSRETPLLQKLAFRVGILEETSDDLEKLIREVLVDVRGAIQQITSAQAELDVLDVAHEPASALDESASSTNE